MMNSPTHGVDSYRRTQVQASTPLEQVVLLYDAALKFMGEARAALERRDIAARRVAVSRTLAIVGELRGTLDMERGGEIAVSLERLYAYAQNRLLEAVMHHDVRGIDDASKVFETLRDAWRTVAASAAQTAKGSAA
jgi:flagellar protein FliS